MGESTDPRPPPGSGEESAFRSLFVSYPDSLLLVDQGGAIVLANPATAALLGYAVDELIGLNVDALVPDGVRPRHAAHRETYGRMPRPRAMGAHMALAARRKDGSNVEVEVALSTLQCQDRPLVVVTIRDIGAYPRVKRALQRARYSDHLAQLGQLAVDTRDLQAVLEYVPRIAAEALQVEVAAVWLLESSRLELRVASVVGSLKGEELGAHLPNLPDTPPGYVLSQGRPVVILDYREEQRFAVPPTYLEAGLVSALAVPLTDRGQVIGVLSVRSKEARRFGYEESRFLESLSNLLATSLQRMRTEEALAHAQRLESIGQLTGGIAHDFNNLLTVIQGNLQVLAELPALAGDDCAQQLLSAAAHASRRGAELTGKLLAFSRRQMLQPDPVDTYAMLHLLGDMLRRTLDSRIHIEIDAAPDCPLVLADPGQLESVLLNIAINARDAMPEGGTLRFRTEAHMRPPAGQHALSGDFVAICVSDNGTGMPDGVREHVFEPFFTTKKNGRGTGLGLSVAYGFVQQSKGAITIDSKPGAGTMVTLYLPQMKDACAPAAADEKNARETVAPGLRVMLVEDEGEVRKTIRTLLVTLGCCVETAATAEEALSVMRAHELPFELLLSDIALGPGMRGTQLGVEAQRCFPGIEVLLMSGFSSELMTADHDIPRGWELLRKPFTRSSLARAMAKLLAERPSASA